MKIKEKHRRDFIAYIKYRQIHREDSLGDFNPNPSLIRNKGETPAIEVFLELDSQGKNNKEPNDPQLLADALDGKALLNGSIKEWASGYWDCGGKQWLDELKLEFPWLPEWVWKAVIEQARRNKPPTVQYHLGKHEQALCGVKPVYPVNLDKNLIYLLEELICTDCIDRMGSVSNQVPTN